MSEEIRILDQVEANNHRLLFECRWNRETVDRVVPQLIHCLGSSEGEVLRRTLNALYKIGLPAGEATPGVIPLVDHDNEVVARAALVTLGGIGRQRPDEVIPVLVKACERRALVKDALFSLIAFGGNGKEASGAFIEAYESPDFRIRQLALRGIEAVGTRENVDALTLKALTDRSAVVREFARKARVRSKIES